MWLSTMSYMCMCIQLPQWGSIHIYSSCCVWHVHMDVWMSLPFGFMNGLLSAVKDLNTVVTDHFACLEYNDISSTLQKQWLLTFLFPFDLPTDGLFVKLRGSSWSLVHFCGGCITLLALFLATITRYLCDSWFGLAVRCIFLSILHGFISH